MSKLEKLRVGFIGSGFIARFMATSWVKVNDAQIAALYNPNLEGAKKLANYIDKLGLHKPTIYNDIYEMLRKSNLDAVWVLNPNYARLDTVRAIVEEVVQGKTTVKAICCEKPLGRTADEAEELLKLVEKAKLLHGYLENQVFAPSVIRGRDSVWKYGAKNSGRPYLARTAEEHGGPHNSWFWDPIRSGGGVLLDMACHSVEAGRYLLTDPGELKESLKPKTVDGRIQSLKWANEPSRTQLLEKYGVDYSKTPAEDYASLNVIYEDNDGVRILSESHTSWCYSGPGLRINMELFGPEYSISINSLQQELNIFLSRFIPTSQSEDFIEKQAAEQGLMPIIPDEASAYGYIDENRHMVDSFRKDKMPVENWNDGLLVTQLMMLGYKSAEEERTLPFDPSLVEGFKPLVAQGKWNRNIKL